ncbi:hypothetical protein C6361_25635 [Plantactinospora sp. BC1]|uniref:hypothetical protein n=1 Tax=Plantactinospora sp. BC1 TaxID=2108470 RepID=UPI000D16ECE2|nr:hypothetical protein [Plantactinospora sp. BC1]AVT32277.1 hypothetical protein C6361_25635 [Plantactinospora sp. BC1]
MPGSSAPDDWRTAFAAEARRRGVPGAEIRAALAEVDTYCAEPGADPAEATADPAEPAADPVEAFGEPAEYAAALAHGLRSAGPAPHRRSPWLGGFVAASTLVGVMALLAGLEAVIGYGTAELTVGQFVSALAGVAGMVLAVALLFRAGRAYRPAPDWRFGLVGAAAIACTTVPVLVWQQVAVRLPGWLPLGAGVLLLVAAWWPLASGRLSANPPAGATPGAAAGGPDRRTRLVRWGLPVALLCVLLVAVLLGAGDQS